MQERWSIRLIRIAAIFGIIGAYLGSHMVGTGSYAFRPIHAHILVVGWLSVFSWGVFYKLFEVKYPKLVNAHAWSAILGAIGLTAGMWFQTMQPLGIPETFSLVFYIVGGTTLLISFALFVAVTFCIQPAKKVVENS
ncbi:hypothetical protein ACFPYN_04965 [Paenisporosarcina macmurdoensis]|uniref:Cbb3-type cytochrome c oxidase subunit I n=1 Tax=Paenisporosarcina macmurdoensis TaxID=212659 RepID=A0ABW1L4E0_9BACL